MAATSAQMSIARMSAPSRANLMACARPCPRAAPVMNATLPSSPDITLSAPSDAHVHWRMRQTRLGDAHGFDSQEFLDAESAAFLAHPGNADAPEWSLDAQIRCTIDQ